MQFVYLICENYSTEEGTRTEPLMIFSQERDADKYADLKSIEAEEGQTYDIIPFMVY